MADSDNWCNALYFPHGRHKLGGVFCRLEPGHDGDHWCEHQDEMDSKDQWNDGLTDASLFKRQPRKVQASSLASQRCAQVWKRFDLPQRVPKLIG